MDKEELINRAEEAMPALKEAWRTLRALRTDFEEYLLDLDGEMTHGERNAVDDIERAEEALMNAYLSLGYLGKEKDE